MSLPGRPLRKFGQFQVFQPRGGANSYWVIPDPKSGMTLVYSDVKGSAYLAAERLSKGVPVYSPKGAMDIALELYPESNISRFDYYNHIYLSSGRFDRWYNGGLLGRSVTDLTPEGRERELTSLGVSTHRKEFKEFLAKRGLTEEDIYGPSAETIQEMYRSGTWPDVSPAVPLGQLVQGVPFPVSEGRRNKLQPISSESAFLPPLGLLALQDIEPTVEWLEDARGACKLLLGQGIDPDTQFGIYESKKILGGWIGTLEAKFGGKWR